MSENCAMVEGRAAIWRYRPFQWQRENKPRENQKLNQNSREVQNLIITLPKIDEWNEFEDMPPAKEIEIALEQVQNNIRIMEIKLD